MYDSRVLLVGRIPARYIIVAIILALAGGFLTLLMTADAIAALTPPAERVYAMGHAAIPWAAGTFARELWICHGVTFGPHLCTPAIGDATARVGRVLGIGTIATIAATTIAIVMGSEARIAATQRKPPIPKHGEFALEVGRATGWLYKLGHGASILKGSRCILPGPSAAQNIVIFGGIGGGKTSSLLNSLVRQALRASCGILCFDVKGSYGRTFMTIANEEGRDVQKIGVGGRGLNLLRDLTPEVAASFLHSALLLRGMGKGAGTVYLNVAVEYAKNMLGVLSFTADYSLSAAHRFVFEENYAMQVISNVDATIPRDDPRRDVYAPYHKYLTEIFPEYETRMKNSVKQSLSDILDAFQHPDIRKAFCTDSSDDMSMTELLDGKVFMLDLPLAIYGVSARTVYTMVKLRMMNVMQRREAETTWDQDRFVVMVADEYQEFISVAQGGALSDLSFWDKSRSAKTIGIISGQGWSSFKAAIGDDVLTDATLQNFRQKFLFGTEDLATLKYFNAVVGKAKVTRQITSEAKHSQGAIALAIESQTKSKQIRTSEEDILSAQFLRSQLGRGRAVALMQIDGESYDDVLKMPYDEPKVKPSAPVAASGTG